MSEPVDIIRCDHQKEPTFKLITKKEIGRSVQEEPASIGQLVDLSTS
jgi:hypothetical protein